MFTLLVIIAFIFLAIKFFGLAFKIAWGLAKVIASILFVLALPALVICVLFASGLFLLLPIVLIVAAIGLLATAS